MLLLSLAVAGTVSTAEPATAQPVTDDTIVVEGQRRLSEKQALRTVTDMTMIVESQIARFQDPVCPMVVGMSRDAAEIVERRIRTTARELGALAEEGRCEANLLLFIAGDGAKLVQDLRIHRPSWFASISGPETRRIIGETPVRAWSVSSVRNEDGQKPSVRGGGSGGRSLLERTPQVEVWSSSFIRNSTRYHLDGSVIIINAEAAEGLTLRQLADYAAMRGLAKIHVPDNAGQMNSILSIFDRPRGQGPRELTEFDRRYLGELYEHLGSKGFERSVFERKRLARAIAAED